MLVLTRLLQQAVLIGTDTPVRITVFQLLPGTVNLEFKFAEDDVQMVTLGKGEAYQFDYKTARVVVELVSVVRGQVRLAFKAPTWIKIDREERRNA